MRSAGVATVLVLLFLLGGQVPLGQARQGHAALAALLLVFGYVIRLGIVLAVFVSVTGSSSFDQRVLGLTVIAVTVGWTAGAVWSWVRWRPLLVDVDLPEKPSTTQR